MTVLTALARKTEGRKGSQRRFEDGGCYLGIPPQRGFLTGREPADDHHRVSLGVQEFGGLASTGKAVDLKSTASQGAWEFESPALRH